MLANLWTQDLAPKVPHQAVISASEASLDAVEAAWVARRVPQIPQGDACESIGHAQNHPLVNNKSSLEMNAAALASTVAASGLLLSPVASQV